MSWKDLSAVERAAVATAALACFVIAVLGWYEVGLALAVPLLIAGWIAAGKGGRL